MDQRILFSERLKYHLGLLWAMLILTFFSTVAAGVYSYLIVLEGWFVPLIISLLMLGMIIFFAATELRVKWYADKLIVNYYPWNQLVYFPEDVVSITVEEYDIDKMSDFNLTRDYMRIMGGQYCVRMELKTGKKLLFSTRKPQELRRWIDNWLAVGGEQSDRLDLPSLDSALDPIKLDRASRGTDDFV